jgi:hypothetical protein
VYRSSNTVTVAVGIFLCDFNFLDWFRNIHMYQIKNIFSLRKKLLIADGQTERWINTNIIYIPFVFMNFKYSVQRDAEYLIIFIRSGIYFFLFIRELFQLQSVMPRLTVMN